jgi:hypothetical protein
MRWWQAGMEHRAAESYDRLAALLEAQVASARA